MTGTSSGNVYRVTVLDAWGQLRLQRIQAPDAQQASQIASVGGSSVVRCELSSESARFAWITDFADTFRKSASIDTVVFSQDMATLMDAGVTIKEAIAALHRRETSPRKLDVLDRKSVV